MLLLATGTGLSSGLIDHLVRMRTIPYLTPLKSDNNQLLQCLIQLSQSMVPDYNKNKNLTQQKILA